MPRPAPTALTIALLLLALAPAAEAVTVGGDVTLLDPIPGGYSVVEGANESDTQIVLFQEQAGLTLSTDLVVDVSADGTYDALNVPTELGGGSIVAGTVIDSYFVHYDRVGQNGDLAGSITFEVDVLGIILYTNSLDGTDASYGTSVVYPVGDASRGLEFNKDSITLSGNTVSFTLNTNQNQLDHIRIFTAQLVKGPEPGTAFLLYAGLLGLGLARRRSA